MRPPVKQKADPALDVASLGSKMRHDVNNSPSVVVDAGLAAYVHHCVCFEVPFGMGQNKLYQIGQ